MNCPPIRLVATTILIVLCAAFHHGYELGANNSAAVALQTFINQSTTDRHDLSLDFGQMRVAWAMFLAFETLGTTIGAYFAPPICK